MKKPSLLTFLVKLEDSKIWSDFKQSFFCELFCVFVLKKFFCTDELNFGLKVIKIKYQTLTPTKTTHQLLNVVKLLLLNTVTRFHYVKKFSFINALCIYIYELIKFLISLFNCVINIFQVFSRLSVCWTHRARVGAVGWISARETDDLKHYSISVHSGDAEMSHPSHHRLRRTGVREQHRSA